MEIIQLRCPNCNAELSIENDLDTFYCKYCGTKILLANQSPDLVKAKAAIHIANKQAEVELRKLEYEREQKLQA